MPSSRSTPAGSAPAPTPASGVVWIGYTTRYRGGGPQFRRVAETLAERIARTHPGARVRCVAVDRKADFTAAMAGLAARGEALAQLHLVAHAGMYGPMFGTTAWPEQLSPHEWRALTIPFAPGAEATFHTCRSARWFAPFFARTFGVPTWGVHGYTAFSAHPERYVRPSRWRAGRRAPLYLFGAPSRKSHGWVGAAWKHVVPTPAEPLVRADPAPPAGDPSYARVADAYAAAFADIRVRADEWRWLAPRLRAPTPDGRHPRVLDVGCGNGDLLARLAERLGPSAGVDASAAMIAHAQRRASSHPHLEFVAIDGPTLPFAAGSFDRAVSLMSFRYLDWDPLLAELCRVVRPEGRLLVVDMVAAPLTLASAPRAALDKLRRAWRARRHPAHAAALQRLVTLPQWRDMLANNPIRAEHELRWYLGSRFPAGTLRTLNVGGHAKVLAFDSGPLSLARLHPTTYP